ncbi:HNH endonuclease signature motif containing protein [Rhodococcus erythropolis]|uniref:HNH endonuclease signature motif containing protein n=1 Tax=Rhodococcus erythropolis TaxID=1833 RepID=UPI0008ABF9A3|nr:HNH endonuclease signature motif containing protein [Rhodococcus erythropolis]OFV75372.1 hypothetical protein RERY_39700 [Rhodococcus erythropolis]
MPGKMVEDLSGHFTMKRRTKMKENAKKYPEVLTEKQSRRFWSKVEKTDGCWTWTASRNKGGYGQVNIRGEVLLAHRLAYTLKHGLVEPELVMDHLCRTRACVNPDHLEPVTQKINVQRGILPLVAGRHNAIKTECPRKHPLDSNNLVPAQLALGKRTCLACSRARGYLAKHDDDLQVVSDRYYAALVEDKMTYFAGGIESLSLGGKYVDSK